jgi:hypothetical protein
MTLDEMVSSLFDCVALAPPDRVFVLRMARKVDGYSPTEAEEIRKLYRGYFGHLSKIKGHKVDFPPEAGETW